MVSALWKASSEGDLEKVNELLNEATSVDIEIKDHTGVTPLIEAIKNGHLQVVRTLLDKGADPTNGSSQGRPDQYTQDPSILELLQGVQGKMTPNGIPTHEPAYSPSDDTDKRYYAPPPQDVYPTYYPSLNSAPPPPLPEGAIYYPPPPPHHMGEGHASGGVGNLPPPEVARFIPCRYFPACRYGSSCLFAHPQPPYFQGPLPPPTSFAPPYDPMASQGYAPNYYPVPPPSFQQPNGVHPMTPLSPPPGPSMGHGRSPSEIVSPSQAHFTATGIPSLPYGSVPPSAYSHPGQVPIPMPISPLPPLHPQSTLPPPGPQSPINMYNNATSPVPPFPVQQDTAGQYPPPSANPSVNYQDINGVVKSPPLNQQADMYNGPTHRDGMVHNRRGAGRRGSFGGRKPPCLFFPAGRCKNGDECRFPHIIADGPGPHHTPYFPGRGGGPRPRNYANANGNTFGAIDEKLATLTIQDNSSRPQTGGDGSSRSHSTDPGNRPRFLQGPKGNHVANGVKRPAPVKQRVPNADEFPVLAGSTTPPSRSPGTNGTLPNGHGLNGPTAAQVLQAPPPLRKDGTKEPSTRGATPDSARTAVSNEFKTEANGSVSDAAHEHSAHNKLPASFAAVATAAPDISKEVSVSA